MNIPKIAVKTAKFKNLMAFSLSAAAMCSPGVLAYTLGSLTERGTSLNMLALVAGVPLQIMAIVIMGNLFDSRAFPFPKFWNKILNSPLQFLQKKENEKLYIALRNLSDTPFSNLKESQLEMVSKIYVERQLNLPYISQWIANHKRQSGDNSLETLVKDTLVSQKLFTLVDMQADTKKVLAPYIQKELTARIEKEKITLEIEELAWLFKKGSRYNNAQAVHENRIVFLLDNGYTLKDKDYTALQKLFKGEKESVLCEIMERLLNKPQATNWVRIGEFLNDYKNEDYFYSRYAAKIKSEAVQSLGTKEQKEIVSAIERDSLQTAERSQAELRTDNPPQPSTLDIERQLGRYMAFEPTYFKDKWDKIKTGYQTVQAHRSDFDSFELIAFFTSLSGSLNVLIASDSAISALPASYQDRAKTLLSENLDLAWLQVERFEHEVGEKHLKTLEVHKNYQTQKLRG